MGHILAIVDWTRKLLPPSTIAPLQKQCRDYHIHHPQPNMLLATDSNAQYTVSGNLHVLFNGYIDNTIPIDSTNAQHILNLYQLLGKEFASSIVGHFACIIWDGAQEELIATRDIFGVKRLYAHTSNQISTIANDIGLIRETITTELTFNEKLIKAHLLGEGRYWQTESIYTKIHPIPPANIQIHTDTKVDTSPYHHWDKIKQIEDDRDYFQQFRNVFWQMLHSQVSHSKSLGLMVSGGLDSSSLAAMLYEIHDELNADVQLFSTITEKFETANERDYLTVLAEHCSDWLLHTHSLDDVIFDPDTVHFSEPFSPFSTTMLVKRLIFAKSKGIETLLYGSAGDMVMLQNAHNQIGLWLDLPLQQQLAELWYVVYTSGGFVPFSKRLIRHFWKRSPRRIIDYVIDEPSLSINNQFTHLSPVQQAILPPLFGNFTHALEMLDAVGEKVGLNLRLPYLDKHLVMFMMQVPSSEHISRGWGRVLQRRALKDILPEKIRQRWTKAIADDMLTVYLSRERLTSLAHNSRLVELNWVDRDKLIETINTFHNGEKSLILHLMRFDEIEQWLQNHD